MKTIGMFGVFMLAGVLLDCRAEERWSGWEAIETNRKVEVKSIGSQRFIALNLSYGGLREWSRFKRAGMGSEFGFDLTLFGYHTPDLIGVSVGGDSVLFNPATDRTGHVKAAGKAYLSLVIMGNTLIDRYKEVIFADNSNLVGEYLYAQMPTAQAVWRDYANNAMDLSRSTYYRMPNPSQINAQVLAQKNSIRDQATAELNTTLGKFDQAKILAEQELRGQVIEAQSQADQFLRTFMDVFEYPDRRATIEGYVQEALDLIDAVIVQARSLAPVSKQDRAALGNPTLQDAAATTELIALLEEARSLLVGVRDIWTSFVDVYVTAANFSMEDIGMGGVASNYLSDVAYFKDHLTAYNYEYKRVTEHTFYEYKKEFGDGDAGIKLNVAQIGTVRYDLGVTLDPIKGATFEMGPSASCDGRLDLIGSLSLGPILEVDCELVSELSLCRPSIVSEGDLRWSGGKYSIGISLVPVYSRAYVDFTLRMGVIRNPVTGNILIDVYEKKNRWELYEWSVAEKKLPIISGTIDSVIR